LGSPQQWLDRLEVNQLSLAKVKARSRAGSSALGGSKGSPLKKEEVLVRELDKLPPPIRSGIVRFPKVMVVVMMMIGRGVG
jgi:hypothetical protein